MAVDSKRTLGITKEFNSVWKLFEENLGGQKQSDLIRRLIFQYTFNKKKISDKEWKRILISLKTLQKFVDGELKLGEMYRNNYITTWNEHFAPVYTLEEMKEICKKNRYHVLDESGTKVIINEEKAYSNNSSYRKFTFFDKQRYYHVRNNPGIIHAGISRFIPGYSFSKPNSYFVIEKINNDCFSVLEKLYDDLKKEKTKTIAHLIQGNQDMVSHFDEIGLFDWPEDLHQIRITKDGRHGILHTEELGEKYNVPLSSSWKDTPPEIEKHLILKPFHLENKRNFRKLKQEYPKIKYEHNIAFEFDVSKNNKILKHNLSHDRKITDGEIIVNQIIEEE